MKDRDMICLRNFDARSRKRRQGEKIPKLDPKDVQVCQQMTFCCLCDCYSYQKEEVHRREANVSQDGDEMDPFRESTKRKAKKSQHIIEAERC